MKATAELTSREMEIIRLLAWGVERKAIADKQEIKQAWKDYAMNNRYSN